MDAEKMTTADRSDDQISLDPVHPGVIHPAAVPAVPATPAIPVAPVMSAQPPSPRATAPRAAAVPRTVTPRTVTPRTVTPKAPTPRTAQRRRTQLADRPPRAADLGFPAVLDHELVAVAIEVEVGYSPTPTPVATPITVTRWGDGRTQATHMLPLHAVVWARAGRVTLVGADDVSHRLTLLAKEEYGDHRLGERWPLGEPEGRAKRVAAATLRDLGDVLTFPVWLVRSAHTSGERNTITKRFLRRLAAASPDTVIHHNQTFGTPQDKPGQLRPYSHHGLVGEEGYPREL